MWSRLSPAGTFIYFRARFADAFRANEKWYVAPPLLARRQQPFVTAYWRRLVGRSRKRSEHSLPHFVTINPLTTFLRSMKKD